MPVNKVVYNTENGVVTLIDLTGDTVTPETLLKGVIAHNAKGEIIVGKMEGTPAPSYTNVIDTVGYTDNARLSTSSGGLSSSSAPGYVTTGAISVKYGDVIRTQGVDFRKSQNTYCAYAIHDGGTFKSAGYLNVLNTSGIKTEFDSEGNLTLTCLGSFNYTNPTLRLTGFGSGANLIVTINEEIT